MEPKKNPAYDLDRYRSMLFTIGLITSLIIVITAFEWGFELIQKTPVWGDTAAEAVYSYVIPTEHLYERHKQKPVTIPVIPLNFIPAAGDNSTAQSAVPAIEFPEEPFSGLADLPVTIPIEQPKEPFVRAEEMPEPIGGLGNFYATLKDNLTYPARAERLGKQGKVFVEFIVNEDGITTDFKVIKGIGAGCDEEAIRVLKLVQWKPGKQRGIAVKVRMVQAVFFQLRIQ